MKYRTRIGIGIRVDLLVFLSCRVAGVLRLCMCGYSNGYSYTYKY
jgi:hypothetical protein